MHSQCIRDALLGITKGNITREFPTIFFSPYFWNEIPFARYGSRKSERTVVVCTKTIRTRGQQLHELGDQQFFEFTIIKNRCFTVPSFHGNILHDITFESLCTPRYHRSVRCEMQAMEQSASESGSCMVGHVSQSTMGNCFVETFNTRITSTIVSYKYVGVPRACTKFNQPPVA